MLSVGFCPLPEPTRCLAGGRGGEVCLGARVVGKRVGDELVAGGDGGLRIRLVILGTRGL